MTFVKSNIRPNGANVLRVVVCFLVLTGLINFGVRDFVLYAQDQIAAIVNNDVITQKDLNDFINFMSIQLAQEIHGEELENKIQSMKLDLLNRLIDDRLILQEAKKIGVKVNENIVKAKLNAIKKRYASDKEFQAVLKKQGLVQADLEERIREQLLMQEIIFVKVKNKIQVNPTEVTEFYGKNKEKFNVAEQRVFLSVSAADKNTAEEITEELRKNGSFEAIAEKYSLNVNRFSAKKGGELRKDTEDAVFGLALNEISQPLEIGGKFYIFKLVNIIPFKSQNLVEVQDVIHSYLLDEKMQKELSAWLDGLKKESYIKLIQ